MSKTSRIGLWCALGGIAAAVLGVAASGGFGPCGPQYMGPFLLALAGLAAFVVGVLLLVGSFLRAAFRKLKVSASSGS